MQVDTTALGLDAERYHLCRICFIRLLGKWLVNTVTFSFLLTPTEDII